VDPDNFRNRAWRRVVGRAGLVGVQFKDLRDSFASHLLTAGINPAYVSKLLGHQSWAVTANHARWVGEADYRPRREPGRGEVVTDLLAA